MKHIIKQEGFGYFDDATAITLEPGDFVDLVDSDGVVHSYYAAERPNKINGITTCADCDAGCADCDAGCDVLCFEYSFRCHDVLLKNLDKILEDL